MPHLFKPNTWPLIAAVIDVADTLVRRAAEAVMPDPDAATPIPKLCDKHVEQYAYGGGTDAEIAARFLIDEELLRQQFSTVLITSRALRSLHLRTFQFELAKKGNGPMLTWLGRNELGQSLTPTTPGIPEPGLEEKCG